MKRLEIGEKVTRKIVAREFWNSTGIVLEQGNFYRFEISPKEQVWSDGKLVKQVTNADGFSNIVLNMFSSYKRMQGEKWFALVGCIDQEESSFFKIGMMHSDYSPPKTGELVCFANDAEKHYENNQGVMLLDITRLS